MANMTQTSLKKNRLWSWGSDEGHARSVTAPVAITEVLIFFDQRTHCLKLLLAPARCAQMNQTKD